MYKKEHVLHLLQKIEMTLERIIETSGFKYRNTVSQSI